MCHLPSTSMIRMAIAACVVLTINPIGCTAVATSAKLHGIKRLRQDNDGRESRQPHHRDDGRAASLVEMEVVEAQSSHDHSAFLSVGDGDEGYISGEEMPHHLLDDSEDLKGKPARQLESDFEYKRLRLHAPSSYKEYAKENSFNSNLSISKAGKSSTISPRPSFVPSVSADPSSQPSTDPSFQPSTSTAPSDEPSLKPSPEPSSQPSISLAPSDGPSLKPSISTEPSISTAPSSQPSTQPSISNAPSTSDAPSSQPSLQPSIRPSISARPSVSGKPSTVPSTSFQPSSSLKPSVRSKAGKSSKTSQAR